MNSLNLHFWCQVEANSVLLMNSKQKPYSYENLIWIFYFECLGFFLKKCFFSNVLKSLWIFNHMTFIGFYFPQLSLHSKLLNETFSWKSIVNTTNSFEMTAVILWGRMLLSGKVPCCTAFSLKKKPQSFKRSCGTYDECIWIHLELWVKKRNINESSRRFHFWVCCCRVINPIYSAQRWRGEEEWFYD